MAKNGEKWDVEKSGKNGVFWRFYGDPDHRLERFLVKVQKATDFGENDWFLVKNGEKMSWAAGKTSIWHTDTSKTR